MASGWTPAIATDVGTVLMVAKHTLNASFAVYVWDYFLTLDQEVERIWPQPWSLNKVLFYSNRYITPTQFLVQVLSFNVPVFSGQACNTLYRVPYASSIYALAMADIVLMTRTYALFSLSKTILVIFGLLFAGHVSVMVTATIRAQKYILPPPLVGCVIDAAGLTNLFYWAAPWIADTVILVLTVGRVVWYKRREHLEVPLLKLLMRDGILYYLIIVFIDTVNIAMFLFAQSVGIKPLGGVFAQILTTVMLNRLQLNLRAPDAWTDSPHETQAAHEKHATVAANADVTNGLSTVNSLSHDIGDLAGGGSQVRRQRGGNWLQRQASTLGGSMEYDENYSNAPPVTSKVSPAAIELSDLAITSARVSCSAI